jgi:hypothetical protein
MWLFKWLRQGARDAILAGAADAAEVLAGETGQDDTQSKIADLRLRLVALPGPEPEAPVKQRRRAE